MSRVSFRDKQRKAWSGEKAPRGALCRTPGSGKRARTFLSRRCGCCWRGEFARAGGCWARPDLARPIPATAYSRSIMRDAPANIEFGGYRPASATGRGVSPGRHILFAFGMGRAVWPGECRSDGQRTAGGFDARRRRTGSLCRPAAACWWSGVRRPNWPRRWKS